MWYYLAAILSTKSHSAFDSSLTIWAPRQYKENKLKRTTRTFLQPYTADTHQRGRAKKLRKETVRFLNIVNKVIIGWTSSIRASKRGAKWAEHELLTDSRALVEATETEWPFQQLEPLPEVRTSNIRPSSSDLPNWNAHYETANRESPILTWNSFKGSLLFTQPIKTYIKRKTQDNLHLSSLI